LQLGLYYLRY